MKMLFKKVDFPLFGRDQNPSSYAYNGSCVERTFAWRQLALCMAFAFCKALERALISHFILAAFGDDASRKSLDSRELHCSKACTVPRAYPFQSRRRQALSL